MSTLPCRPRPLFESPNGAMPPPDCWPITGFSSYPGFLVPQSIASELISKTDTDHRRVKIDFPDFTAINQDIGSYRGIF